MSFWFKTEEEMIDDWVLLGQTSDGSDGPCDKADSTTPDAKICSPKTIISGPVISYTVQASDTLMSIAARFDTTPSELTKLNRLSTRFLFPGQVLTVPDKGGAKENQNNEGDELNGKTTDETIKEGVTSSPLDVPQPGTLGGLTGCPKTPANSVELDRSMDKECLEKFLKIQVRHITDGQGVVAGVLLVTPNAVMFDPNVSDPLVLERGSEAYGVIAPMDLVVNAALYYDIAHMRVKDTAPCPKPVIPKPEIYFGPSKGVCPAAVVSELTTLGGSEESPSKEGVLPPELVEGPGGGVDGDDDSACSCGGDSRGASAFPKAFDSELLTPGSPHTSPTHESTLGVGDLTPIAEAAVAKTEDEEEEDGVEVPPKKRTTSVTFSGSADSEDMTTLPENDTTDGPPAETRKQKVMKRISYPLSWMENLGTDVKDCSGVATSTSPQSAPWTAPGNVAADADGRQTGMFSNVFNMSNVSSMLTRRTSLDIGGRRSAGSSDCPRPSSAGSSGSPLPPSDGSSLQQHSQKRAQYKDGPKFGLKSMVSMEDMPDLFASFDKLIPKPASVCDESPLYLCLRMGMPQDKPVPKTTPIMTYGRKIMRPEYWFSIPKSRTEELFHFFQVWSRELYGELDESAISRRGLKLIEEDVEVWPGGATSSVGGLGCEGLAGEAANELKEMTKEMTKESWEEVLMTEELQRALHSSSSLTSLDIEPFLPEIHGNSEIIDEYIRKNMYRKLPVRVQGHNWGLVFSTAQHGFSLKSLYRKMHEVESAVLLFIQDTNQNKFGAFVSCPLRVSDHFYGTGECFLFRCRKLNSPPEKTDEDDNDDNEESWSPTPKVQPAQMFEVYPWTGENTFFVKGNNESLFIGGGDGNFGIMLDGDLYKGRTQCCKTFNNPSLADAEDFIIRTIECWFFD